MPTSLTASANPSDNTPNQPRPDSVLTDKPTDLHEMEVNYKAAVDFTLSHITNTALSGFLQGILQNQTIRALLCQLLYKNQPILMQHMASMASQASVHPMIDSSIRDTVFVIAYLYSCNAMLLTQKGLLGQPDPTFHLLQNLLQADFAHLMSTDAAQARMVSIGMLWDASPEEQTHGEKVFVDCVILITMATFASYGTNGH